MRGIYITLVLLCYASEAGGIHIILVEGLTLSAEKHYCIYGDEQKMENVSS